MNTFRHRGAMGDIIYSLVVIKALGGGTLYIRKENQYNFLFTLLSRQDGLIVKHGVGDKTYNLGKYRKIDSKAKLDGITKHLVECHAELFNMKCDFTQKWIEVDPVYKYDIMVNRTARYHDKEEIDWKLLEGYNCAFIGFNKDYNKFFDCANISMPRIECIDALEMAQMIAGSKLFIGNQSLCFAIAEALKHPRVLEVYYGRNNCQPHGKDGYTYLTKELIEGYING